MILLTLDVAGGGGPTSLDVAGDDLTGGYEYIFWLKVAGDDPTSLDVAGGGPTSLDVAGNDLTGWIWSKRRWK